MCCSSGCLFVSGVSIIIHTLTFYVNTGRLDRYTDFRTKLIQNNTDVFLQKLILCVKQYGYYIRSHVSGIILFAKVIKITFGMKIKLLLATTLKYLYHLSHDLLFRR